MTFSLPLPRTISRPHLSTISRLLVAATLAACLATAVGPMTHPTVATASTAGSMESRILNLVNAERAKRGLVALRLYAGLVDLAGDRAAAMASSGVLAHPSCLSCTVNARDIQWHGVGEVIAYSTWPWGSEAAKSVVDGWKGSPPHWTLLMSNDYNYVGFGVAYRSANGATFAAGVLTESNDRTKPTAKMRSVSRSGTTLSWTWSGADTKLQRRTAGLRNFDVQYRVDGGAWKTIRSGTTARSLSLSERGGGHWYGLRVRARDGQGNLSPYTAEKRVWVPASVVAVKAAADVAVEAARSGAPARNWHNRS
jgi:uncharacterized protein YkwD